MTQWQHKVEVMNISEKWSAKRQREEIVNFEARLNVIGSEGWELVSYEAVPMTGSFTNNIKGYAYLSLFKRPVQ